MKKTQGIQTMIVELLANIKHFGFYLKLLFKHLKYVMYLF